MHYFSWKLKMHLDVSKTHYWYDSIFQVSTDNISRQDFHPEHNNMNLVSDYLLYFEPWLGKLDFETQKATRA